MKILVTGGCGFIGRNLIQHLRTLGHEAWSLDVLHHPSPQHIRADVRSFRTLDQAFRTHQFNLVYHLAAEAGRWNGEDHYEALWSTNVIGTKHIIRLQESLRFRLVFMSSSEVYGDYDGLMEEGVMDRIAIRQLNDYAMTKWVGEQQLVNSAHMFSTESVRIRMFNVFGVGEPFGANRGVVARFIYHALHDWPYTVYLDHHRTTTFIDDAVRTLAVIPERFHPGEVYNLGGTEYHDIKTISDLVLMKLGKDDRLVTYKEAEAFTTRVKQVDLTRAIRDLGHAPKISLSDGLERTIAWASKAYLEADSDRVVP